MDESMLALMEKSRMFKSIVPGFFVEAKAISLEGFSFWLPHCFDEYTDIQDDADGPLKRFRYELNSFFRKYLETWFAQNKQSKDVVAATKDLFFVASFLGNLGQEKGFIKLKSGKDIIKIHEPISNAEFRFKRMGDLLAFNIYRPGRNPDEEHSTGKKAVLTLCRRKDSSNNRGVYELVQRVEITLELPNISENGKTYSLVEFGKEINRAICSISVNLSPEQLIEKYHKLEGDSVIGKWCGLQIGARLIHFGKDNEADRISSENYIIKERSATWRRGNLVRLTNSRKADFALMENSQIALMISVSGSLPQREIFANDCSKKYLDEQFLIANVGSMVAMNLGSMMLNRHDEQFYKMNPIER